MKLEESHRQAITRYAPSFRQYLQGPDGQRDQQERDKRVELYRQLLAPENLRAISEPELSQVIGSLWASALWGNKAYLVGKIVQDNSLETLREVLSDLLWGKAPLPDRFDAFGRRIKGLGPASVTELLAFVHPEECGLWNDKARKALVILGLDAVFPKVKKYHLTGTEYVAFNDLLKAIRDVLTAQGLTGLDLLGVDFFLFHVWETQGQVVSVTPAPETADYDFDHDEMVDKLVSIGQWMGFKAIPQNSLWGTRRRECLPTANQVLELSLRLFRRACV